MEISFLTVLLFGFILGVKHSLEPDHIIAVSTIASKTKTLWRSSLAGVYWGIGHTVTLFIVGLVLIVLKAEVNEVFALSLEFLVGIMLVYLGVTSMFVYKKRLVEQKEYSRSPHIAYGKSFLIGIVHGLAGSAAMILLTVSTVSSVWQEAVYIIVFGAGTIVGMLFFTTLIGVPFVLSADKKRLNRLLTQVTGGISAVFGIYYMYNLGITEGLFKLWLE
ncbi:sulfite exporter TauE/SafE family protein [Pseudalkalibacillus decolorationis]|uniref:sulfite exporter TauE/SafE family protein n=1 Tax=Pseudalkalibacillus decolorationis TaxID=163879 RepID=UPI0021496583|nr:sulfite exporter TauE/SafE family protein [Pseudalkalibacillus decolorationis]